MRQLSRNLNIIQKIWHVNTFALSKMWYIAQVLPIPERFSQQIELTIGYYIWRGHMFRVHRNQLRQATDKGGFNLINVQLKCKALLIRRTLLALHDIGSQSEIQFWKSYVQHTHPLPNQLCPFKKMFNTIFSPNTILPTQEILNSKLIYQKLLQSTERNIRIMEKYPNLKWEQIWKTFKNPHIPTDWKTIVYAVVNETLATEFKKFQHSITSSPTCKDCGQLDTIHHRLISCPKVNNIWLWMNERMTQLNPSANLNSVRKLLLHMEVDKTTNATIQVIFASAYIHTVIDDQQNGVNQLRQKLQHHYNIIAPHMSNTTMKIFKQLLK